MSSLKRAASAVGRFLDRFGWLIAIVFLAIVFHQLHEQGKTQAALSRRLAKTQGELVSSQKESTETRIVTVTQRCNFTRLVIEELERRAPPADLARFQLSYAGCEEQLAKVKRINSKTPAPGKP